MGEVQVFHYGLMNEVRATEMNGEPWFVAKDVCSILGIQNSRDAITALDEDEKGVGEIYTPGGNQQMTIINESGLYALVIRSNKPEAKAFKRWITHEVIPAIRKQGGNLYPSFKIRDKGFCDFHIVPYAYDENGNVKTREHLKWTETGRKAIISIWERKTA